MVQEAWRVCDIEASSQHWGHGAASEGVGEGGAGGRTVEADLSHLLVVEAPLQFGHARPLEQQVACHFGELEAVVSKPQKQAAPLLRVNAHGDKVLAQGASGGDVRLRGGENEPDL